MRDELTPVTAAGEDRAWGWPAVAFHSNREDDERKS